MKTDPTSYLHRAKRRLLADLANWVQPFAALYHRIRDPLGRPKALLYFFLAIGVFAGLEIWALLIMHHFGLAHGRDIAISFTTYAVTLSFTALSDTIVDRKVDSTLRLFILTLSILVVAFSVFEGWEVYVQLLEKDGAAAAISNAAFGNLRIVVVRLLPAWLIWWVVSASDERFQPDIVPNAAAGGDPTRDL